MRRPRWVPEWWAFALTLFALLAIDAFVIIWFWPYRSPR